jgi:hypothetical protein
VQGQGSPFAYDVQGQVSFTLDSQVQGIPDQGGPYTQDVGQYTQGTDSTNASQGHGSAGTGVEQYDNPYGGDFPAGYDPFQATQNTPPLSDFQSQNPFTGGGLQDQMSQIPFGATPPSVQVGSSAAVAAGASFGLLVPAAAVVAHRNVFGKTPTLTGVSGMFSFSLLVRKTEWLIHNCKNPAPPRLQNRQSRTNRF